MFHVRRRPADSQPRRRKKKPLGVSNGSNHVATDREGPILVEITHSGEGGRSVKLTAEPIEVSNITTKSSHQNLYVIVNIDNDIQTYRCTVSTE